MLIVAELLRTSFLKLILELELTSSGCFPTLESRGLILAQVQTIIYFVLMSSYIFSLKQCAQENSIA